MRNTKNGSMLRPILLGTLLASLCSVAAIIGFALLLKKNALSDRTIMIVNQILKMLSILAGVGVSVGKGGKQGYLKGGATGLGYMVFGLGLSSVAAMRIPGLLSVLSELAFGGAVGALCGVFFANLPGKTEK